MGVIMFVCWFVSLLTCLNLLAMSLGSFDGGHTTFALVFIIMSLLCLPMVVYFWRRF